MVPPLSWVLDSSYQTWGGQFNAYGLYCTGTAKITGGELIGTANGTDRELDYSAYGFYGSNELTMSGGTLRALSLIHILPGMNISSVALRQPRP